MSDQPDPRDAVAALRAQFDQARESAKEAAGLVANYQAELVRAGVTNEEALTLTIGFQNMLLGFMFGAFGPGAQPPEEGPDA